MKGLACGDVVMRVFQRYYCQSQIGLMWIPKVTYIGVVGRLPARLSSSTGPNPGPGSTKYVLTVLALHRLISTQKLTLQQTVRRTICTPIQAINSSGRGQNSDGEACLCRGAKGDERKWASMSRVNRAVTFLVHQPSPNFDRHQAQDRSTRSEGKKTHLTQTHTPLEQHSRRPRLFEPLQPTWRGSNQRATGL